MKARRLLVFLALLAVTLPLAFALAMDKGLNHDEHQHVAAGALLGWEGVLPYRDYPHFHTPYLAAIYAPLFAFTAHPVLVARSFSAFCAAAILALLGSLAFAEFRARGRRVAWTLALAVVALGGSAAVFIHTTGRAWNHEPALFLAVLSAAALLRGWKSGHLGWWAAAGGLLGLCIGVRLTYAPLLAPFGLLALFGAGLKPWHFKPALAFSAGVLVCLAPAAVLAALDPEAFLFGNWEFARVNVEYRFATGDPRTMTLLKKVRFLWKEILRDDLPLFIAALLPWLIAWRARVPLRREGRLLLLILPFVLIGMVAPSPAFNQYFYPLVPLALAAAIYGLASLPVGSRAWRLGFGGILVCAAAGVTMQMRREIKLGELFHPEEWTPLKIHAEALAMRQHVASGAILTLAPIFPLEAGLRIDRAFATGPFSWRVSPFVNPEKARRLEMVTPADLERHLAAHPPQALLLGHEDKAERPLLEYAKRHNATPVTLDKNETLWVLPPAPSQQE